MRSKRGWSFLRRALGAAVAATLALPAGARAGGFAVATQSATAGGTGAAGTARDDDAGAAWYNPAALADGAGLRVGIGLLAARPSLTARAMDGSWETHNDAGWSTPPHVSASVAAGDFAAGVWAGVPFGSGVAWPEDWPGRFEIVRSQIEVFRVAPFAAWRFGRVRVALGAHADFARMRVARQLDFIDVEGDVAVDLDGHGAGVDAAVFVRARPDLDLGATYKSRTSIDLDGGADFDAPDAFEAKTMDQPARSHLTLPDRIALGGAWRHGPWRALADIEIATWSVYDEVVIDFDNDATPDARQINDWRTTVGLRAGAEWAFARNWVARAGAYYDPTPARDETLAPSSPDSSRIGATAGASVALGGGWRVDAFAEYMRLLGRTAANDNALAAEYGGHAQLVGFGVRYQR